MMRNKVIILVAAIVLALSAVPCCASYWAYTNCPAYVYESTSLFARRMQLATNTKIYVVKADGLYFKVKNSKKTHTGYILQSDVSKKKTSTQSASRPSWAAKVVKKNWFSGGQNVLKRGKTGSLYCIKTGRTAKVFRTGGRYHATCVPVGSGDKDILLDAIGGKWKWKACPAILNAGGKYIAVSFEVDPSSKEVHIHMTGSKSHTTGKVSATHQRNIDEALEWAMADDCGTVELIPDFGW